MSASSHAKNATFAPWVIEDPGTGAALPNDQSGTVEISTTAAGETNTLAAPVRSGVVLTLNCYETVSAGTDTRVVTVTNGFDETSSGVDTTLTLNAQGGFATLQSVKVDTAYEWRLTAYDSVVGPATVIDDLNVAGDLTLTDGGTVTQATNKGTGVTLSKRSGQITTHNAELAAAAEETFTVTNTVVAATDVVIVNLASGPTAGEEYIVWVGAVAAGSFDICLTNASGSAASDALVINFVVIGGASS